MVKGGRQSTCLAEQHSRELRENNVPAGTLALVRSPLALRCSREQTALHTLIRHRHLTPSCGGRVPTAERTHRDVTTRRYTRGGSRMPELGSYGASRDSNGV